MPLINSRIIDSFGTNIIYTYIKYSLILFIVKCLVDFFTSVLKKRNQVNTNAKLKVMILTNWACLRDSHRMSVESGKIINLIENDCDIVANIATNSLSDMISIIVNLILSIIIVSRIHYLFLPIILFFSVVEIMQIQKKIYKWQASYESQHTESVADINSWVLGMHDRYEYLCVFKLKDWAINNILGKIYKNYKIRTKQNTLSALSGRISYLPKWLCESVIYIIGGWLVINGDITLGLLFASHSYASRFLDAFRDASEFIKNTFINMNAYERVSSFLDYNLIAKKLGIVQPVGTIKTNNELVVKNVDFQYSTSKKIFENLNFTLPLKGIVLLQGDNGSGKSTLIKLIMGLEIPSKGDILVNNINTKDFTFEFIHRNFSCAFQEGVLFNDTLYNNISAFNPVQEETIKGLVRKIFPDYDRDFNDLINAFGDGVSGGQAKRILLSRALYKKANILILDEVDTGIDSSGYSNMISILKSMSKNCLVLIVSHQKSDVQDIFWDYKLHINNNTVNLIDTKEEYISLLTRTSHLLKRNGKTQTVEFTTRGISMLPLINPGDIVGIEIGDIELEVGDIVLFRIMKTIFLHRIIMINRESFICKGDNNCFTESIDREDIIGKVLYIKKTNPNHPFGPPEN
jgi:ABC-type multidrug transport system fused ATPase/permease subunit